MQLYARMYSLWQSKLKTTNLSDLSFSSYFRTILIFSGKIYSKKIPRKNVHLDLLLELNAGKF